jgi:outer membrane protein
MDCRQRDLQMTRLKFWAMAVGGSVSLLAMGAVAQAQTFEESLVLAYNSNPTLQAERARLRSTDEGRVQARAGFLPSVSASASISEQHSESQSTFILGGVPYSSNSTTDSSPKNYSVTANQSIYAGGRNGGALDQATALVYAGRESLRSVEQTVLVDAATAFMDVRRDEEVVNIRRSNADVLAQHLDAARDRFEVGEITRTDVAQAEARLSGAQAELSAAQAQLATSRAAYQRVTGQPAATLQDPPALPELPGDLASAAETAYQYSPQLLAAQYGEQAAHESIRIARSSLRPQVSISASATGSRDGSYAGDQRDSTAIVGQVSVPLFTGGMNRSRVRAAIAQEEQARHQVLEARRIVTEGVTNAWYAYVTSLAVIESSQQAVRANEIALDGVEQEAYVGLRTTLDVLDAEQELLGSRLTLVTAERDSFVAGYRLLQAMGLLSAERMGLDVDVYEIASQSDGFDFPNFDLTPWN